MSFPTSQIPSQIKNVSPTDYNVQIYNYDDGTTARRLRNISPVNTQISLIYEGVDSSFYNQLLEFYRVEAQGKKNVFDLPEEVFSRHPSTFFEIINMLEDPNRKWRFNSVPRVETVVVDVYNITVELKNVPIIK